jgi:hypothetical protein
LEAAGIWKARSKIPCPDLVVTNPGKTGSQQNAASGKVPPNQANAALNPEWYISSEYLGVFGASRQFWAQEQAKAQIKLSNRDTSVNEDDFGYLQYSKTMYISCIATACARTDHAERTAGSVRL